MTSKSVDPANPSTETVIVRLRYERPAGATKKRPDTMELLYANAPWASSQRVFVVPIVKPPNPGCREFPDSERYS